MDTLPSRPVRRGRVCVWVGEGGWEGGRGGREGGRGVAGWLERILIHASARRTK